MYWRCELHCHSEYSRDCDVSLERLVQICKQRKIDAIALTDHDEIAGAQALQKMAPDWLTVIVGEEICTKQGDLIGLFLKERITPKQDIETTVHLIHEQGGLALLPHPLDRIRREAVGRKATKRVAGMIDFIEIFNARCLFSADNDAADRFAKNHDIPGYVGSDAHIPREYGQALNLLAPFHDAASFAQSLRSASFEAKRAGLLVHASTRLVRMRKKP